MKRSEKEFEFETPDGKITVKAISQEFDFDSAAEIMPEITGTISGAVKKMRSGDDLESWAGALQALAYEFAGGKLLPFLPKLLKGVIVVIPNAKVPKLELRTREAINAAFTGRKKMLIPIIGMAIQDNFYDFFDVGALIDKVMARMMAQFSSATSSPSTKE